VWGEADAKLRGFSHLYHWLLGTPTARGAEQIRAYRRYRNELCLGCHAGSATFVASGNGVHLNLAANLVALDPDTGAEVTSCLVCHGPAHPSLDEWRQRKQG
jgi:hypothetical protein